MGQALSNIISCLCGPADDEERPLESNHQVSEPLLASPCKSSSNAALLDAFVVTSSTGPDLISESSPDCTIFIPPSSVDFRVAFTDAKHDRSPSLTGSDSGGESIPDCTIFIPPSIMDLHLASTDAKHDQSPHSIGLASSSESSSDCTIFISPSSADLHAAFTNAKHDQSPSSTGSDSGSESIPDCTIFIPPSSMDLHLTPADTKHDQIPSSPGPDLSSELRPVWTILIPPSSINLHEASTTTDAVLDQNPLVSEHCMDANGALQHKIINSSQCFNPFSGSGTSEMQQDIPISSPRVESENLLPFSNSNKLSDPTEVFYKTIKDVEESIPVSQSLCEQNLKLPSKKLKKKAEKINKVVTTEERWIKHYSSGQQILLVGEGDFSFSASLAVAFGYATNMIATSLNSKGYLRKNYKNAMSNVRNLRKRGCVVIHGVDATVMANHLLLRGMIFDRVVFNFPLSGFFPNESRQSQLRRYRELVDGFLANAREMISEKGEIHITHKTNGFFGEWNLELLASSRGLCLIDKVHFNFTDFPGYHTKYGFGGDKCFNCNPSRTYKFGR